MVDFVHPFPGKNPGDTLTKQEIIRALRLALAAEEEATQLYDLIAEYVDDKRIKKIMKDVADEEQVHKGEFQKLLDLYVEDEIKLVEEGKQEAEEKIGSRTAQIIPETEIEKTLRKLFGRGEESLCKIKLNSKEWDALNYALNEFKREHSLLTSAQYKESISIQKTISIMEDYLKDPEKQCKIPDLREAIGELWYNLKQKVYSSDIIASLRKLASLL